MFKKLFEKKNLSDVNNSKVLVAAILVYAAKVDDKYTNDEKEIELKYDLERNVQLVSFNKGKIDISFNEKLNKNFIKTLTDRLLKWTGERWVISLSQKDGSKTFHEKNLEQKSAKLLEIKNSNSAKEIFSSFPDAKLIEIKDNDDA